MKVAVVYSVVVLLLVIRVADCAQHNIDINTLQIEKQELFNEIRETLNDWTGEYNKLQSAKIMIESFIASEPNFIPIYIEKARLTIMMGYTGSNDHRKYNRDALEVIHNIQSKTPDYPKSYVLAGHIYVNLGNLQKARESLEKAEKLGTNDPWLHLNWSELLTRKRMYAQALDRSKKALLVAGDNNKALVAAVNDIITLSSKLGKSDFSIDVTNTIFSNFSDPLQRLRIAKRMVDYYKGHQQILTTAYQIILEQKKLTPELQHVDIEFAYLILKSGYKYTNGDRVQIYDKEICKEVEKILDNLHPQDGFEDRVFEMLFKVAMSNGDFAKAKTLIKGAREKSIDPIAINASQAHLYYATEEYASAIAIYENLAKDDPDFADNVVLMSAYAESGRLDKLQKYHMRQVDRYPTSAWTLGNYASFLLHKMEDVDGAIVYGKKALEQMEYPLARNETCLALLIKASRFYMQGDLVKAKMYYTDARLIGYSSLHIKQYCSKHCTNIYKMRSYFRNK